MPAKTCPPYPNLALCLRAAHNKICIFSKFVLRFSMQRRYGRTTNRLIPQSQMISLRHPKLEEKLRKHYHKHFLSNAHFTLFIKYDNYWIILEQTALIEKILEYNWVIFQDWKKFLICKILESRVGTEKISSIFTWRIFIRRKNHIRPKNS